MENKQTATEYSTGSVQMPKNYRKPLTLLLLTVLFAGSLVCTLSFWGIRLTGLYKRDADTSVQFIKNMRLSPAAEAEHYTEIRSLGIQGRFLTEFEQRYYDLPEGVYIHAPSTSVPDLCTGDVLIKINDEAITNQDKLDAIVDSHAHGAALNLQIYRNGHYQTISAFLIKNQE